MDFRRRSRKLSPQNGLAATCRPARRAARRVRRALQRSAPPGPGTPSLTTHFAVKRKHPEEQKKEEKDGKEEEDEKEEEEEASAEKASKKSKEKASVQALFLFLLRPLPTFCARS